MIFTNILREEDETAYTKRKKEKILKVIHHQCQYYAQLAWVAHLDLLHDCFSSELLLLQGWWAVEKTAAAAAAAAVAEQQKHLKNWMMVALVLVALMLHHHHDLFLLYLSYHHYDPYPCLYHHCRWCLQTPVAQKCHQ